MWKALILTHEQEEQKKKDYFAMQNKEFAKKWKCSTSLCIEKYWRKTSTPRKRRSKLNDNQIRLWKKDYQTMSMVDFCDKYNILPKTARTIFWKKEAFKKLIRDDMERVRELSREVQLNERKVIAEQYKRAMEMYNATYEEIKHLVLNEWWGFSEIFAGEKIDGKIVPKDLYPPIIYKN